MSKLTPDQLQRGQELAKEYHHGNLASVLGRMVRQAPAGLRSRGVGEEVEGECYVLLEELDKGGKTPEGETCWLCYRSHWPIAECH